MMLLATSLCAPPALAQATEAPEVNAQLFRPAIDATRTLWTDDARRLHSGDAVARVVVGYLHRPLVLTFGDGSDDLVLVRDAAHVDLAAGYGLGALRVGVDLPVFLYSAGELSAGGAGLGDMGLDGKLSLLDPSFRPLGLAIAARLTTPTATVDAPLRTDGVTWEVAAVADKDFGDLLLAVNLGTFGQPEVTLANVTLGDQFFYRAGAGYAITGMSGLSMEMVGHISYGEPLGTSGANPAELLLGGWHRLRSGLMLRGAVGAGLGDGIGSPGVRTLLAASYGGERAGDADGDGLADNVDSCPEQAEDYDGWRDRDGCPDPTVRVQVRIVDSEGRPVDGAASQISGDGGSGAGADDMEVELHPGRYTLGAAAPGYEGIEGVSVVVPDRVARHEVVQRLDASPGMLRVTAADADGQPVAVWVSIDGMTPLELPSGAREGSIAAGEHVVVIEADGYATVRTVAQVRAGGHADVIAAMQPTRVDVTNEKINIKERVYFETAKASIRPESYPLLDEVATVLLTHPELLQVRIEGHTDSRGTTEFNRELSEDRANSVKAYLQGRGVESERLVAVGCGEDRPVDLRGTSAGWEKNRRVEFFIVRRANDATSSVDRRRASLP